MAYNNEYLEREPQSDRPLYVPSFAAMKKDPNKIWARRPVELIIPVYLRVVIRQLTNVSAEDQSIHGIFNIYVTYPFNFQSGVFKQLKSKEIREEGELKNFIKNNMTLEVNGKFIDIINITKISNKFKNGEVISNDIWCYSAYQNNVLIKQEQQSEDEDGFQQQYIIKRPILPHNKRYMTYLINGDFRCDGRLNSKFFPYHQLTVSINIEINQLYYKDVIIKYNIMNLSEIDQQYSKHFVMGFDHISLSKFGIYSIKFKDQMEQLQYKTQNNFFKLKDDELTTKSISFNFKVYSFNLPFILRNQISLWVLSFATIMLLFTKPSQINNLLGNIILISVSEISLLSNFRKSKFKTQHGSIYQFTLLILIILTFLLIIDVTRQFYTMSANQLQDINEFRILLKPIIYTSISLFILNVISLVVFGCKTRSSIKIGELLQIRQKDYLWNEDIFRECIPFPKNSNQNLMINQKIWQNVDEYKYEPK